MKFQLAINLERMDDSRDMKDVARHTLEMVQMADEAGFDVAWAAEHHALEMTIAPNPFQILTWWASHTDRIRLGTAVAVAAYWHPINLAGEAAMIDLLSGGRLEFGIGSGAYQREFDRMHAGLKQSDAYRHMHEMLPALKALWAGDYEHNGEFWSFPSATSVPKPVQQPHPPIWVAARAPVTFDYAVENHCNVMSWPLTRPFAEAEEYKGRLDQAMAAHPECPRPTWALMRHTALYDDAAGRDAAIRAIQTVLGQ
jgi:alkanesulfonate monooxygenase SsuD/methylene tetrahydromethanopterin reductase-like flavin-dependent oxidoreductase (luciferase family)